jgi:CheY-like chemotaxis protein
MATTALAPAHAPVEPAALSAANVLVVEDGPVTQAVAVRMLESCGYQAQVADNGHSALQVLSERSYAAVLMDCRIPELDGYETTRAVRRREADGRHVFIIAMTANSMQGDRERCLAVGMDDYLAKPLRIQALKDALAGCVSEPPMGLLDEAVVTELETLDGDLLNDLVSLYFDEAARHESELRGALDRGETRTVAEVAHKLQGSSMTIGAAHVALVASEFERTAGAGDETATSDLLDKLRTALGETKEAFRSRMADPDGDVGRKAST